jgi:hypothetical protein
MPAKEKALTPLSLVFQARIHPVKQSLIILRPRKSQKARSSYSSIDIKVYKDPQSPSSSLDKSSDIETSSKPRTRTVQSGFRQSYAINISQATRSDLRH